jgi:hypothetical protein
LTGDASVTDPACELSPKRSSLLAIIEQAQHHPLAIESAHFRTNSSLERGASVR